MGSVTSDQSKSCLLYTSDAADERSSVDLGGRRIIKKKTTKKIEMGGIMKEKKRRRGNEETSQGVRG